MAKRIQVGYISGAHGIKGQLEVKSLTQPANILQDIETLFGAQGQLLALHITGQKKKSYIATMDSITDRNMAEALKGTALFAAADDPTLPAQNQLIDTIIYTHDGTEYGRIIAVHNYGAGDIAEIKKTDGDEELVPLSDGFIQRQNDRLIITPPEYIEAGDKKEDGNV